MDDGKEIGEVIIENYKVLGKVEDCVKFAQDVKFIIGIGNNFTRENIAQKYKLTYYTAIHPSSTIGIGVQLGEGTVVMANSCINPSAKIGKHCIVNTGAIVEHDNVLEDYVHISPNAVLAGTVKVRQMHTYRCGRYC